MQNTSYVIARIQGHVLTVYAREMISPRAVNNTGRVHHTEDASSSLLKLIVARVRSYRRDRAYRVDWLNRLSYIAYHTYSIYRCITRGITNARPTGQPPCSPSRLRYDVRICMCVSGSLPRRHGYAFGRRRGASVIKFCIPGFYSLVVRRGRRFHLHSKFSGQEFSLFDLSLTIFPVARQQNVSANSRWEVVDEEKSHRETQGERGGSWEKK